MFYMTRVHSDVFRKIVIEFDQVYDRKLVSQSSHIYESSHVYKPTMCFLTV